MVLSCGICQCLLPLFLKSRLYRLVHNAERLNSREVFVVSGKHMPGRVFGRGVTEHVVDGSLVARPFLAVSPVLGGDFPLFFGGALSGAEAL